MSRFLRGIAFGALSATSFGVALLLCEVAARLLEGQPLTQLRLLPPAMRSAPIAARLDPTLGGGQLPDDIDPTWLGRSPAALKRRPIDPVLLERVRAAPAHGVKPFETQRIWNRNYVDANGCQPGNILQRLTPPLLTFDPTEPGNAPTYRYPSSQTLPSGLVTNRFGWRGPDIPLDKPPRTIRLAFVGASTTVGLHNQPFSYPEYVVHWLNLWAERIALPVRFDGINAGREGIQSPDIAAIIRQEILPLEPDLVLHYEGANQSICARPPAAVPPKPARGDVWQSIGQFLGPWQTDSQLARSLEAALRRIETGNGSEPEKPPLPFWKIVRDETPSVTDIRRLRGKLRGARDLDSSRAVLSQSGGELALSSFAWLVFDGLRLDPVRHGSIFRHLNEWCWPYRYADVRRDLDNQNYMLERYAALHQLPFVDVAAMFPPDPDLFFDSIHLNTDGERVHAWIVFRALIPIVRARLDAGIWPRADMVPLQEHPGIRPGYPVTLSCNDRRVQ